MSASTLDKLALLKGVGIEMKGRYVLGAFALLLAAILSVWALTGGFATEPVSQEPITSKEFGGANADDSATELVTIADILNEPVDELTKAELEWNQTEITESRQNAIKTAIKAAAPSVVQIDVVRTVQFNDTFNDFFNNDPFFRDFFRTPFRQETEQRSFGSGFFFEFGGEVYILTNNHVTEQANSIQITTEQGLNLTAEVVGTDAALDIAILKPLGTDLVSLSMATLGNSDALEIGDWVIAIGNPLGLSHTVTAGIVSALGREMANPNNSSRFRSLIQTDAAINPGNSGGPLVNAMGEVIGINTMIASNSEGLGFAISINNVRRSLPQLIQEGRISRAWLGVYIQDITPALASQLNLSEPHGVLIADLIEGSPAEGILKRGDVITHVNNVKTDDTSALQSAIEYAEIGLEAALTVIRSGKPIELVVKLGERPDEANLNSPASQDLPTESDEIEAHAAFGIQVMPLAEQLAQQLQLSDSNGVVIKSIDSASRAYWAEPQLQNGDLIIELNFEPIGSIETWNRIVSELSEESEVVLTIQRSDRTFYSSLP